MREKYRSIAFGLILLSSSILIISKALASEHSQKSETSEKHGSKKGKSDKKEGGKGHEGSKKGGHGESSEGGEKQEGAGATNPRVTPEEAKMIQSAEGYILTPNYVHRWASFPKIEAADLKGSSLTIIPERGYASVVLFLASWCIPCQEIVDVFKKVEKKYADYPVRFYYVFAHDTKDDIRGFATEFGLGNRVLVASHDLLKSFSNPELPTIFVGDRDKFLLTRYEKTTIKDLANLDELLDVLVTY